MEFLVNIKIQDPRFAVLGALQRDRKALGLGIFWVLV